MCLVSPFHTVLGHKEEEGPLGELHSRRWEELNFPKRKWREEWVEPHPQGENEEVVSCSVPSCSSQLISSQQTL